MNSYAPVEQEFLTYKQAGLMCGVSRWTLLRAVKSGDLEVCKVGSMKRFERQALRRWMRSRR